MASEDSTTSQDSSQAVGALTVIAPDGDVIIKHKDHPGFLVDSRTLSRGSPVFEAMFHWKEGQHLSSTSPPIILSHVDTIIGLEHVLQTLHGRPSQSTADLFRFKDIAGHLILAADYYQCVSAIRLTLECLLRAILPSLSSAKSVKTATTSPLVWMLAAIHSCDSQTLEDVTRAVIKGFPASSLVTTRHVSPWLTLVPSSLISDLTHAIYKYKVRMAFGVLKYCGDDESDDEAYSLRCHLRDNYSPLISDSPNELLYSGGIAALMEKMTDSDLPADHFHHVMSRWNSECPQHYKTKNPSSHSEHRENVKTFLKSLKQFDVTFCSKYLLERK